MIDPLPVFLIEDDPAVRKGCEQALALDDLPVRAFADAESALAVMRRRLPGAVVSDVKLPGQDGLSLLRELQRIDRELPVILVTGHGDVTMAVQAMREGAYDFIEKPFTPERLVEVVKRALEKRRLLVENQSLRALLAAGGDVPVLGQSPPMQTVRRLIAALAPTDVDLLIGGETGCGKEVVARAIHAASGRKGPFVALNCGALPETVFESEIFGHEAGAFTGAAKRRIGKIEYASGGTLFLDEIESMPMSLQVKLLRVLQERVVERLGSNTPLPVDCRVLAAAKGDLKQLAKAGSFRADLYYRLNVAAIELPALRERRADIPLLLAHFLGQAALRHGKEVTMPEPAALARWQAYDWPGNVRELKNAAERYCLGLPALPDEAAALAPSDGGLLNERVEGFERQLIENALLAADGQVVRAAETLGLPRKTLYDKLQKYGLRAEDFRR